eukprot:scaffold105810_cov16-Tisochrysis_lutea.AAC.1
MTWAHAKCMCNASCDSTPSRGTITDTRSSGICASHFNVTLGSCIQPCKPPLSFLAGAGAGLMAPASAAAAGQCKQDHPARASDPFDLRFDAGLLMEGGQDEGKGSGPGCAGEANPPPISSLKNLLPDLDAGWIGLDHIDVFHLPFSVDSHHSSCQCGVGSVMSQQYGIVVKK